MHCSIFTTGNDGQNKNGNSFHKEIDMEHFVIDNLNGFFLFVGNVMQAERIILGPTT